MTGAPGIVCSDVASRGGGDCMVAMDGENGNEGVVVDC